MSERDEQAVAWLYVNSDGECEEIVYGKESPGMYFLPLCYESAITDLRAETKEKDAYLKEIAVEAGMPPESIDIATCRAVAHQVKSMRDIASDSFFKLSAAESLIAALRAEVAELKHDVSRTYDSLQGEMRARLDAEAALAARPAEDGLAERLLAQCSAANACCLKEKPSEREMRGVIGGLYIVAKEAAAALGRQA